MKVLDPTIYVPHKVDGQWANSAFQFTGFVDTRRIKREIIKAFKNGGEKVSVQYIQACINKSLTMKRVQPAQSIPLPDEMIDEASNKD